MKYYSEILEKTFDTEKELVAAEKEHAAAEKRKADAKALIAKESKSVEEAFQARNAARRTYNEKLVELRKTYNEKVKAAQEEFNTSLIEVSNAKDAAEKVYDTKLKEFQNAHPEGYRITLKDGDNVVTLTSINEGFKTINKEFDDLLDVFSNLLKHF